MATIEALFRENGVNVGVWMCCDRGDVDVRLEIHQGVYLDVDRLLERGGNDVERTARLVLSDFVNAAD